MKFTSPHPITTHSLRQLATLMLIFMAHCDTVAARQDSLPTEMPTWTAQSATGAFKVLVSPRQGPVPIAQFHDWVVTLRHRGGEPVHPARIAIAAGMPGHGHGMPSQPQVTRHLGCGRYLVEGMKFNMTGDWVLQLVLETPLQRDDVRVELSIEH